MLRKAGDENRWQWHIDVLSDPDPVLILSEHIMASSDSQILDHASRWFNLAKRVIGVHVPSPWYVARLQ